MSMEIYNANKTVVQERAHGEDDDQHATLQRTRSCKKSFDGPQHHQKNVKSSKRTLHCSKRKFKQTRESSNITSQSSLAQMLQDKLQGSGVLLSPPFDMASLISDAHGYIKELKARIADLNPQDHLHGKSVSTTSIDNECIPLVHIVMVQSRLHRIHIICKNWSRSIVALLEHLEDTGFEVSDANISCMQNNILFFDAIVSQHEECEHLTPCQLRASIFRTLLAQGQNAIFG